MIARSNVNQSLGFALVASIGCATGHPSRVPAPSAGLSAAERLQPLDRLLVNDPVVGVFRR